MNASILTHPRVIAAVTAALRSCGYRKKDDLPDGIAEVQVRVLQWARTHDRELPTDPEEVAKLCSTVAINWRIDERRKKKVRKPHEAGLCEEPDEERLPEPDPDLEDPVDLQRKLEVFVEEVREARMPAHAEHIAVGLAEGKSQAEIAQGLGVSENVVHYGASELRKRFRAKLAALGLLTLLTMLTLLLFALLAVPMAGLAQQDFAPASAHPSRQRTVHVRVEAPELRHRVLDDEELRELEAKPH